MRKYRTLALGAASLALILSACTSGGSGSPSGSAAANKPAVKVGSAGFWEAAVTAEMYAQALEAKGYTVERHLETTLTFAAFRGLIASAIHTTKCCQIEWNMQEAKP